MSLRFVTRKLKTQTLGDDDTEVGTDNGEPAVSLSQADPKDPNKKKDTEQDGCQEKSIETPKEKRKAASASNARSRRALRHRHQACDDSESEEDDDQIRESSKIQKGKSKNITGSSAVVGEEKMQSKTGTPTYIPPNLFPGTLEQPKFVSPTSSVCLPNQQKKVSSVFDSTHGLQPPTCNPPTTFSGIIPKPKSNHAFGATSTDTTMMLDDNYSSEEELKEIISSEKQRKRSGGGSVKDGKSQQHTGATRDYQIQHGNEDGNARKLSAKRGSLGADNIATCRSISPSLSSSPSSGKMIISCSRPSSGRSSKLARATPSTNAAEKRKWSEVEYANYCCNCKHDECSGLDRGQIVSDIQTCGGGVKKNCVSSGCTAPTLGSNVRCRASGTISAPPVPAVLLVRGSGTMVSGGCSARCDSVSRSGSSGCSSQHSCCGDDEDVYIGGDGGCCNLRSTPRLHNISRGSSAGGSGTHGNRHSDVPTPVQFCTSPPLDVHRPTRNLSGRCAGNDSTHIQSDAIPMSRKAEREYGKDGSLFVTTREIISSGPSSSSPPPSKLFHFDDANKNERMSGNTTRYKPIPVCAKGKSFQSAHYTGKDNRENSEKDADEEVENMMENSKPLQNFEFMSMAQEDSRSDCNNRDKYSEAIDDMTRSCNKILPSKVVRGKEVQRFSRGLSLRSSCKMKADAKQPSALRRRSHSQSRIPSVHQHFQDHSGFYHGHHTPRGVGHLHRRRQTPSPHKRHRLTPRPPPHNINGQRPSLDFEKMQQIKKRVITSWRPQGTELSLFCW